MEADTGTLRVEWVDVDQVFLNPANPRHNDEAVPQVAASLRLVADGVVLAQVFGLDDDVRHGERLLLGNWTGLTGLT